MPAHLGTATGSGIYEVGATAKLVAKPASSKSKFIRWEDATGVNLGTSRTLTLNLEPNSEGFDLAKEVTAIFEDTSNPDDQLFSLEVVAEPFGLGTVLGGGAYLADAEVTLTAVPNGENKFAGWAGDASGVESEIKIKMDGHKKVTAFFGDVVKDTDEDGLSDLYEKSIGTDPDNKDTDEDGLTDGDEMNTYFSDPLKIDSDDDGFTDKEEITAGTGPKNPNDFPFISKNGLVLRYQFKTKAFDLGPGRHHGKVSKAELTKDRYNEEKNAYFFNGIDSKITASGFSGLSGNSARAYLYGFVANRELLVVFYTGGQLATNSEFQYPREGYYRGQWQFSRGKYKPT